MAHFAKLGANGKVIQVLTMDNDKMLNADGVEDESVGQQWLETHNNWPAQMCHNVSPYILILITLQLNPIVGFLHSKNIFVHL